MAAIKAVMEGLVTLHPESMADRRPAVRHAGLHAPPPLTPREIVTELDKHVIAHTNAKRAVAIALRNRMRRQKLPPELAEDWAARLKGRYKTAAQTLLRRAAAAAFRRRDFRTCDRLTELADEIN